jgi:hypothetical protein
MGHAPDASRSRIKQCVVESCLLLVANYSGKTLKFVAEQEGWKKPGEDLVKTIWTGI